MLDPRGTRVLRTGGAVALTLAAVLLTVNTPLGSGGYFLLAVGAILVSARFGGLGPGLVATLVGLLSIDYMILPPLSSLYIASLEDMARLTAFGLLALLITWLAAAREREQNSARKQVARQAAVAQLGQHALATHDLDGLFDEAVGIVCDQLNVEYCKLLQALPGEKEMLLRAGRGWKPGLVGHATVSAGAESQAGYTLVSAAPIIVRNLRKEKRFSGPPLLLDHGVVSGMSVIIHGHSKPFGVLSAHTRRHRAFSRDDIHFLQSIGNVLAMAIERNQTEAETREQRERLRVTLTSIGDAVIATDAQGNVTFANAQAEQITGWSLAQMVGQPLRKALHLTADTDDELQDPVQVLHEKSPVEGGHHLTLTTRSGKRVSIDSSAAPMRDDAGHPAGVVIVFRDMTAREEAERKLRESEDRYRTMAETATDGIITVDEDGRVLTVNPAAERIFGYGAHDLVGQDLAIIMPEDSGRLCHDVIARYVATGEKHGSWRGVEVSGRHRNGRLIPLEISFGEFTREGKHFFTSVIRDVSERRAVQDQIQFQANILQNVRDSVIVTDPQGKILYWNAGATAIFGYAAGEMMGGSIGRLYPEPADQAQAADLTQIGNGDDYVGEWEGRHKDGHTVWVNIKTTVLRDAAGQPNGFIGVATDITERKQTDNRLAAQYAVTRALAESETITEATPRILKPICECVGWQVGAIWTLDRQADVLRCLDVWHKPGIDVKDFETLTREMLFVPELGLPGRVWSTGQPYWTRDVTVDLGYPRAKVAAKNGLHSGVAFPISADGFIGVIEFFSREIREPDRAMMEMMDALGSQIAQFIKRMRAEEALRVSEEQHSIILQGVADGITLQDPSGRLVYANRAAAQLIGYPSPQELLDAPVHETLERFEVMDEEGKPFPLKNLPGRVAVRERRPSSALLRFRIRETGQERWSQVDATPVLDERGQARLAINIFHDVTERRRSEEEIRDQRELLQVTLASIGDGVISTDTHGRIQFLNPVAETVTGWTMSESVGRPLDQVFRVVNEETGMPAASPVERVLREQAVVGTGSHAVLIDRDGRKIPIDDSGAPIRDNTGSIIGVVLIFRDISERKLAERDLSRLAAIVKSSDDVIISTALDGAILTWNPAAERLFGYTAEEMIGRSIITLYPPDRLEEFELNIDRLRRGEPVDHFDTVRVAKDGRMIDVSDTISLIRDSRGHVIGASKILRDITERKRSEDATRFLAEASDILVSSLDYTTTLASVAKLAVPRIGDWCSVHIKTEEGPIEQVVLTHVNPHKMEQARELLRRYPPSPESEHGVLGVIRTGKPELIPIITDEIITKSAKDVEHLRMLVELGLSSSMIVPMVARGRTLGAFAFFSTESGRRFGPNDLALAQDLARRAALSVDNARLYQRAQALNEELEQRVIRRTIELQDANQRLQSEVQQRRRMNDQLRLLSAHLQSAREEERIRVAREIHDEIGQVLTALKMDLSLLGRDLVANRSMAPETIQEEIRSSTEMVDEAIQTMHNIIRELRPEVLDHLGLRAALEWQIQEFQSRTQIDTHFESDLADVELDPERSTAVFRILQEALTNVARHSEATRVDVDLHQVDGDLILQVRDNGKGIAEAALANSDRFGILGMRERAHVFGGEVNIEGSPNAGTIVSVRIPLGMHVGANGDTRSERGRA